MVKQVWAWDVSDGEGTSFNVAVEGEGETLTDVGPEDLVDLVKRHDGVLHLDVLQGGEGAVVIGTGDGMTLPGHPKLKGVVIQCPVAGCTYIGMTWSWDDASPPECPTHGVPTVRV